MYMIFLTVNADENFSDKLQDNICRSLYSNLYYAVITGPMVN